MELVIIESPASVCLPCLRIGSVGFLSVMIHAEATFMRIPGNACNLFFPDRIGLLPDPPPRPSRRSLMPDISRVQPTQRSLRLAATVAAVLAGGWMLGAVCVGVASQMDHEAQSGTQAGSNLSFRLPGALVDAAGDPIDVLQAAPNPGLDQDGDGLPDAQEAVLGLLPMTVDSDGDGFGDGEEVARQSDPLNDQSVPQSGGISASLSARGEGSSLRLVISIHEPAGEVGFAKVRIGALTSQGVVSVPIGRFLPLADIYEAGGVDDATVTVVDIPLHANFVHANHHVTFFLAAGNSSDVVYSAASKIDVQSSDGVLLMLRPADSSIQSLQGGSIRQPIPPPSAPSIPTTWIPGAVCFQRSVTVGGNGAVVVKQVVEANCIQGWDTFCASDCSSSVGSTFETIDPAALIGG